MFIQKIEKGISHKAGTYSNPNCAQEKYSSRVAAYDAKNYKKRQVDIQKQT